jgi:hypothetical protein
MLREIHRMAFVLRWVGSSVAGQPTCSSEIAIGVRGARCVAR